MESLRIEKEVCKAVSEIYKGFSGFRDEKWCLNGDNAELTREDRARLQSLLREFLGSRNLAHLENDFEIPPTMFAILVYDVICKSLNNPSPYNHLKLQSIQKARLYKCDFLESLCEKLESQANVAEILEFAIRICVLGNVLDYGAQCSFDLEAESQKVLSAHFAYFDLESFMLKLQYAKRFVMIGDNAGENEFDEILLYALKELYPHLEIFYFVRGAEIINDITLADLKRTDSAIFDLAEVVDSGVVSPGFIESLVSTQAKEIYQEADLILAKGMGNFESMESQAKFDDRVFLLFKIKCEVVKNYLQKNLGDFVFWNPNLYAIP